MSLHHLIVTFCSYGYCSILFSFLPWSKTNNLLSNVSIVFLIVFYYLAFSKSYFSYDDYFEVFSSHRNPSAPCLNSIPYKVYQKCPKVSNFFFKIFQGCFKRCEIPIQ